MVCYFSGFFCLSGCLRVCCWVLVCNLELLGFDLVDLICCTSDFLLDYWLGTLLSSLLCWICCLVDVFVVDLGLGCNGLS